MHLQRSSLLLTGVAILIFAGCESYSGSGSGSGYYGGTAELETNIDSVSYSLGYQNGIMLKQNSMEDINLDKMIAGMQEGLSDSAQPKIAEQQMRSIIQTYQMEKRQESMQRQQEEAVKYNRKGQEFLAENASKQGVHETESGLQYQVLEEGNGASPKATDTVAVHYKGTTLEGVAFDSSYGGQPVEFPLNRVIEGWTEGVQLMKEGARYKFWIPADLAYGNNPRPGGPIKPGQLLVFEVELVEVK